MLAVTAMQLAAADELPIDLAYVTVAPKEIGQMFLYVTVSEEQTIFRDGDRTLIIDYAKHEVRRLDEDLDKPRVYPLVDPDDPSRTDQAPLDSVEGAVDEQQIESRQPKQGLPIADQLQRLLESSREPSAIADGVEREQVANREIAAALSRYEIKNESAGAPVRGFAVSAKTIWFGRGFLHSRIVGKLHYSMWGRRFTERRVKYWVTKDHADYRVLDRLAVSRTPILRANPMLAHVDWTLLIPELGGIPVAMEERGRNMVMRIELVD